MRRVVWQLTTIGLVCMVLVACGGSEPDSTHSSDSVSTPVSTPVTPEVLPLKIGQVQWTTGTDPDTGAPLAIVDAFTTESPAIIAVVQVENLATGTDFTATWTLNDVPIAGTDMRVTAEDDMSSAWIAFSFTRDANRRYPVGQLGVTITASDGAMRESSVRIVFPN